MRTRNAKLTLAHEQMRHHAEHDGMTGIWNHRVIVGSLHRAVARSHRDGTSLSVMIIDLDYFKRVNDTFGHQNGDLVLQQVAECLRLSVRPYDLVGRYGGEEFLVVLPGMDLSDAQLRAEEIRGAIEAMRLRADSAIISVTASIGVSSGKSASAEHLIRAADTALYHVKFSGRNAVSIRDIDSAKSH